MSPNRWSPATAALALLVAGCSGAPMAPPGPVAMQPVAALGQETYSAYSPSDYVLRPADQLSVTVFREEDLSLERVSVGADGFISMPLIGRVQITGLTVAQLEGRLEELLGARYLRDPNVSVNVIAYGSHLVTVEGAVTNPGLFAFVPGTRLSGGLALANGLSRVSNLDEVAVFRQTDDGGIEVAKFDYAAVRAGTMLDPLLEPGDRIVVGTDGLSQFYQDILRAVPIFALFTRI